MGHGPARREASLPDLEDGPYPSSMILEGSPPGPGDWACDWNTARRLRLRVGDTVRAVASFPDREVPLTGLLAAIYGPSGMMRDSIVLPIDAGLESSEDIGGGSRWSDLFVSCSDPEALVREIETGPDADRLLAVRRLALHTEAKTRLAREVGPFLRHGAVWVTIGAFVSLALWQQSVRASRRIGEYAILTALGMRSRSLVALDALEQVLILVVSSLMGAASGLLVMREWTATFVPPEVIRASSIVLVVAVVVTTCVGALSVRWRLSRRNLTEALSVS